MSKPSQRKGAWALWIGVVIMFLLVITAWTILINIAKNNPVDQVELDTNTLPSEATKPVAEQTGPSPASHPEH